MNWMDCWNDRGWLIKTDELIGETMFNRWPSAWGPCWPSEGRRSPGRLRREHHWHRVQWGSRCGSHQVPTTSAEEFWAERGGDGGLLVFVGEQSLSLLHLRGILHRLGNPTACVLRRNCHLQVEIYVSLDYFKIWTKYARQELSNKSRLKK